MLPPDEDAGRDLRLLGLSDVDRVETLAARPSPADLEGCYRQLHERMGTTGPLPPWPPLPNPFAYVWGFLAALPAVRSYHASRGIPDEASWRILRVLADQIANRRAIYASGGLHTQDWMTHHFRGAIYALGRLHFERLVMPSSGSFADGGPAPGDHVLGLHIPEGRLAPDSVDESLGDARTFFARHFPDEPYRYAVCTSWILDPQLADYLPPDSNIIRFARRFTVRPAPATTDSSSTVVEFLFKRPIADLDHLPRSTTLQRAVVDHIRAGNRWYFPTGWFPWTP